MSYLIIFFIYLLFNCFIFNGITLFSLFSLNLLYFISLYLCLFNLLLLIICFTIFLIFKLYSKLKGSFFIMVYGLCLLNLSFYFILPYLSVFPWTFFPVFFILLINFIYFIINYNIYKSKFKSIQFSEFEFIINQFLLYFY